MGMYKDTLKNWVFRSRPGSRQTKNSSILTTCEHLLFSCDAVMRQRKGALAEYFNRLFSLRKMTRAMMKIRLTALVFNIDAIQKVTFSLEMKDNKTLSSLDGALAQVRQKKGGGWGVHLHVLETGWHNEKLKLQYLRSSWAYPAFPMHIVLILLNMSITRTKR